MSHKRFENDDPRAPWNDPRWATDPREPWNHPAHRDDPRRAWNRPGAPPRREADE